MLLKFKKYTKTDIVAKCSTDESAIKNVFNIVTKTYKSV